MLQNVNSIPHPLGRTDPMAVPSTYDEATADADTDFVRDSYLAYIVPLATGDRFEQALEQCTGEGKSPQSAIEAEAARESLFFGTSLRAFYELASNLAFC